MKDLNTVRCDNGYIAVELRSFLIKSLGKDAFPCGKDAAHRKIFNLFNEIFGITCVNNMQCIRRHKALNKRTHRTLNKNVFGILLLNNTLMEDLEGIIDITVDTLIFEKVSQLIKPNSVGILQNYGVIKHNRKIVA